MKKTAPLLLASIFCLFSLYSFSQWEFQNPVPTNAPLNDIQFVDENHGWAVGEYGTILHSADGGESWEVQYSDEGNLPTMHTYLTKICFVDLENGWAVGSVLIAFGGEYGQILHTEDGGVNWESQYSSLGSMSSVHFVDADNGWAIGSDIYGGIILNTNNGGETWEIQYDTTSFFSDLIFTDIDQGWVVGYNGMILHTEDGGENWEEQESGTSFNLRSVCFTDINNGWVAGDDVGGTTLAKILHTTDGGNTWQLNYDFGTIMGFDVGSIFFIDPENGWLTYNAYYRWNILRTTDGGNTWSVEGTYLHFRSMSTISFLDENTGWALGENAIIFTNDGGETWEPQNTVSNTHYNSISFIDEDNGWALGNRLTGGIPNFQNVVVKTTDGGNNWEDHFIYQPYIPLGDVLFLDINHGWVIGWNAVVRTFDGGLTWVTSYLQDESIQCIHFINLQTGWVAGEDGAILISMDGGEYWEEQISGTEEDLFDIYFADLDLGWAVGGMGTILHTSNGGQDWEIQSTTTQQRLFQLHFVDPDHGWAIGDSSTLLRTIDGGANWESLEFNALEGTLRDVYFTDSDKGWIVGSMGGPPISSSSNVILSSTDGGESWQKQDSLPFGLLTSIQFINEFEGWAVGSGGTILHTDNGGTTEIPIYKIPEINESFVIFPNPCSGSTNLRILNKEQGMMILEVFGISGRKIKELMNEELMPGTFEIELDLKELPAGVYYCVLRTKYRTFTAKVIKL